MTEPTRVLTEGTLRYMGTRDGVMYDWMDARVFVLEYRSGGFGSSPHVIVVAREPMFLHRLPSPIGSIHDLPAYDDPLDYDGLGEGQGDLLRLDVEALVPS